MKLQDELTKAKLTMKYDNFDDELNQYAVKEHDFVWIKEITSGRFANVDIMEHRRTKTILAVKKAKRPDLPTHEDHIRTDVEVLLKSNSKNIPSQKKN